MKFVPILAAAVVAIVMYEATLNRAMIADWFRSPGSGAKTTVTQTQPASLPSVVTYAPQPEKVASSVSVRGKTEAARQVVVRAEIAGKVVSEPQRRGTFVRRGQPLCQMTSAPLEGRLSEALARVKAATAALAEAELIAQNPDSLATDPRLLKGLHQANVDIARANLAVEQATVETRRAEIAQLSMTAPFDGLLESDSAELGSLLQPGDACATVIQMAPIKAVGQISEVDVGRIDIGTLATITLLDGTSLAGRVTFLSRAANPESKTFRVEVDLPNTDLALREGQSIDLSIVADPQTGHRIPNTAIDIDGDLVQVPIVNDAGEIEFVKVSLPEEGDAWSLVLGLPNGPRVILEQMPLDRIGQKVQAQPIDPETLKN